MSITSIMSKLAYSLGFHIRLNFARPYDRFILNLGMNPFHDVIEPSCCYYKWRYVNGRAFLYMGTLVRSYIAFGAHANISPLGCGSPFSPAMSLSKSSILLLKFMLPISLGTPLYISSCNCIFMSFACLLVAAATIFPKIFYF